MTIETTSLNFGETNEFENYQNDIWEQIKKESENALPVHQRIKFKSFTSYSHGKGRRRKEGRIVELLVIDNKYAYVVEGLEIKHRKFHKFIAIDVLANEVLTHLPSEERTADNLLQITIDKAKK